LPFDSIRIHYALSIDLEVWIGTASANVVKENEARSGGVILGCKVLEPRFEFLDENRFDLSMVHVKIEGIFA